MIDISHANILVVDDTPTNLRLLSGILTNQGYTVRPVPDGCLAITSAHAALPDLILLDIMMPGISGYEVCQRLKADEGTRDIPVIFISALHEVFDKVKAFELGGVDYITKPFQTEEVLSRVKTHLTLQKLRQTLQEKNIQLHQEIVEHRQTEEALKASEYQLRALNANKDKFFSIIAHDLKGPLSSLDHLTQFAEENLESYSPDKLKEIIILQRTATENLSKLLENLLTWSRIQRGMIDYCPQHMDIGWFITRNIDLFRPSAEQKQILLKNSFQGKLDVYVDGNMINTVIRNLISNALKFTHPGGTVEISAQQHGNQIEVSVSDNGIGIEREYLPKLFQIETKYKRLGTAREKGTGLGLILCKEFVEKHRGKFEVESEIDKGSTFSFFLPKSSEKSEQV